MIKIYWPEDSNISDADVCDWLADLVSMYPKEMVFEFERKFNYIHFFREEDAMAFRLRFGL